MSLNFNLHSALGPLMIRAKVKVANRTDAKSKPQATTDAQSKSRTSRPRRVRNLESSGESNDEQTKTHDGHTTARLDEGQQSVIYYIQHRHA
jgi:hypothetical protein